MASRENSKPGGQTTHGINVGDEESLQIRVLSSLPWNEPPLCWLNVEQKSLLKNSVQIFKYSLGSKIWSTKVKGYQFFIVSGSVRLREEHLGNSLVRLHSGDWFGNLNSYSKDCKAIAASTEVITVVWNTSIWAELLTPEIESFWKSSLAEKEELRKLEIDSTESLTLPLTPTSVDSYYQPSFSYPFVYL